MERRKLTYEPKIMLDIILPNGDKTNLFIRGNVTGADVLERLGFSPEKYWLCREDEPLEQGETLKELEITHHTVLEIRSIELHRRVCCTCGEIISGPSPEALQLNIGVHIGKVGHKKFREM